MAAGRGGGYPGGGGGTGAMGGEGGGGVEMPLHLKKYVFILAFDRSGKVKHATIFIFIVGMYK